MRYRRIAALGVPLALQTATMLLGQVVVVALIGRMGEGALYVQALYAPVEFLLVALVSGFAVTLQVLTARRVGAGDRAAVAGYWGGLLKAGLLAYAVLAAVLIASAGALGGLVDVAPAQADRFGSFLAAMVLVGPLRLGGELCSAVLRGVGRGVAATSLTTTYVVLNATLVAVLGVAGGGGLAVVPVAAAVAGAIELAAGLAVLSRAGLVTWAGARRSAAVLAPVVGTGLPVAASYVLLFVVNLLLVRIAATGGPAAVAGFNAGYTAQTAVLVPAIGFGSAIAVLVNQRIGAGDRVGAATVFRRGLALVACGYAVVTLALLVVGSPLAGLLAEDPAVVEQARGFLTAVGPTFGCTGLVLAVLTVLQQVGRGGVAVAMNLGYFAVLIGVGWAAVASTGRVSALHVTMAVVAAASLVVGAPVAAWLVRRTIATRAGDGGAA
ncbi:MULTISPECIES: MATE family efflux transporter [unclassified Saccharothrix]|uniref:MATE family efflux transporter n=1 Tax=unclassified Saccharothrix TaxID=2593673 RepID=UPI00307F9238